MEGLPHKSLAVPGDPSPPLCPWPSPEAVQNLSFPGCTRRTVMRVCATICPGNHVLG